MPLIPLIILGVVFLVGAVALAIGHKGWHWATVAAAWLVLLTAVGAFFLVGMLGKREQEWRSLVAAYQSAITRERDAMVTAAGAAAPRPDPSAKPLAVLEDERQRWERVRDRIDTWRGRHWEDADFVPPAEGRAGTVTINGLDNSTINPGAEFYLFDTVPIEEGGRFLGAYRVDAVDKSVFTVSPISTPDAADKAALAKPRDGKVIVYEDLPVDRSLAFYRTPVPAAPGTEGEGAAPVDGVPGPTKTAPEAMLRHLERKLEELRLHDTPLGGPAAPAAGPDDAGGTPGDDAVAADGGPAPGASVEVPDPALSETPPLGVRWARVVFSKPFVYAWPDGTESSFAAGEVLPSIPAEQVAILRERGAEFESAWSIPPGLYWAEVEFTQPHSFPRAQGEPLEFDTGRTATFDLDTARTLVQAGVATIRSVVFRRPLADGNVALRGAGAYQADGRSLPMDVNGLVVVRRILEEEKNAIDSSIAQLGNAKASTTREIEQRRAEAEDLTDDLEHWKTDVTASIGAAEAFTARVNAVRRELESSETAIVLLGRELAEASASLTQAIDQSAPAPTRPPLPADAVR